MRFDNLIRAGVIRLSREKPLGPVASFDRRQWEYVRRRRSGRREYRQPFKGQLPSRSWRGYHAAYMRLWRQKNKLTA